MPPRFAPPTEHPTPITILGEDQLDAWLATRTEAVATWVRTNGFKARLGQHLIVSDNAGNMSEVLFGWGHPATRARGRFHFAAARTVLPQGVYCLHSGLPADDLNAAALGWLMAGYRFERYRDTSTDLPMLVAPEGVNKDRLEAEAAGAFLTLDLINTPTNDMGPQQLEDAFCALAAEFEARCSVVRGDDLLAENLPLIHAVGRAAAQAPRLLDMTWGRDGHPTVTLVGKGVCFDTGGLNLKPGASMGLMKKDMGGAATVLGLARIIMALGLPIRLRVLVPAVENAVSGNSYRPGDVLISRKGLSIEVNNTDAEGRLVLADALALADEEAPDYLFCMATLTGAARVALGPDLVPFYTGSDSLSHAIARAGRRARDPVWRMPFWDPYEAMLEPDIADLDNAPKGGFAGSLTAALFLRRFVSQATEFAHFDIYGWTPKAAPGRPKGAAFQGARAILEALLRRLEA